MKKLLFIVMILFINDIIAQPFFGMHYSKTGAGMHIGIQSDTKEQLAGAIAQLGYTIPFTRADNPSIVFVAAGPTLNATIFKVSLYGGLAMCTQKDFSNYFNVKEYGDKGAIKTVSYASIYYAAELSRDWYHGRAFVNCNSINNTIGYSVGISYLIFADE